MLNCSAIKHGVTIFPSGKIGPCCQISADYLKPISELSNPNRFDDLLTEHAPPACHLCHSKEQQGLNSYRTMFNCLDNKTNGIQFVDIRNTNLCNLKCRYCGPHFSSQWAKEFNYLPIIEHQPIDDYKDLLITDSLHWMYFTGGEPLISKDHWDLLEELIQQNKSSTIKLMYNTNLTTISYKDKHIIDIWKKFKQVSIRCSIDSTGESLEYIRSGSRWDNIKSNLIKLQQDTKNLNIQLILTPVLSILNIWFIKDLYEFSKIYNIPIEPILLTGPDYLALDVMPDSLKSLALDQVDIIEKTYTVNKTLFQHIRDSITNNINSCLFQHTLTHILLLDKLRNENLFDLLPFKDLAIDTILKNYEYE